MGIRAVATIRTRKAPNRRFIALRSARWGRMAFPEGAGCRLRQPARNDSGYCIQLSDMLVLPSLLVIAMLRNVKETSSSAWLPMEDAPPLEFGGSM